MYKIQTLLASIITLLFISSCTKAVLEESETPTNIEEIIKYDPEVKLIMTNYCTSCHGGLAPSGGFTLTNYNNVREKVEQGSLLSRINNVSNPMPPGGLMDLNEREIIQKWKTDGYLE